MRRPLKCAALLVCLALGGCTKRETAAVLGFEGELTIEAELVGSPPRSTVLHLKGERALAQLPPTDAGVLVGILVDASAKKSTTLFYAKHAYAEEAFVTRPPTPTTQVTDTGRRDRVAGTECDVYEVRYTAVPAAFNEICVARSLAAARLAFAPVGDVLMMSDEGLPGLPLRVLTRVPGGAVTARMEVTKIVATTQPETLFQIPAGFTALPKRGAAP